MYSSVFTVQVLLYTRHVFILLTENIRKLHFLSLPKFVIVPSTLNKGEFKLVSTLFIYC